LLPRRGLPLKTRWNNSTNRKESRPLFSVGKDVLAEYVNGSFEEWEKLI